MLQSFPDGFKFGAGNSDHQCESYDPNLEDIRDVWDRIQENATRGRATDFVHRYPEDIGLAAKLGCKVFRFSISWAKVEPAPGQYDKEVLQHYLRLVETIRSQNMEPMVTLHHFTWPIHIEERGGMIADDFPSFFCDYAAEVAAVLGPLVPYWITFNEPTILTYGYTKPWWERNYSFPPGLPDGTSFEEQMKSVGKLMKNLFVAHTSARSAIKRANPDAKVGSNPALLGLPTWVQRFVDRNATKVRNIEELVQGNEMVHTRKILEKGAVDMVIAALTVTSERAKVVDFSESYYVASQAVMVKTDSDIQKVSSLGGHRVAVVATSTAETTVRSRIPEAILCVVKDHAAALKALEEDTVAAFVSDDVILMGFMKEKSDRYRLVARGLTQEPYAVAVTKGNPDLLEAVNHAVKQFKSSGGWASSFSKHFPGEAVPQPEVYSKKASLADLIGRGPCPAQQGVEQGQTAPLAPKGTSLRKIQERGYISVAVKHTVPGFGYYDPEADTLSGLEIDLAREIASLLFGDPERVRFRRAKTRQRLPLLRSLLRFLDPILKPLAILNTILSTNWWHLGMAGRLPSFLCPESCVGQQDFVGLDYYWGISSIRIHKINGLIDAILKGRFDRAPVWPRGLRQMIEYNAKLFPDKEIVIVESGCVDVASGTSRSEYFRKHVREVQRALAAGLKVGVYIAWSITTNFEWGHQPGPENDFGLFHIDLLGDPELTRHRTEAAEVLSNIIRNSTTHRI